MMLLFFFFQQKTAYEVRISDWSSDVCSSDLDEELPLGHQEDALPVRLHGLALRRGQPAEAAALHDRRLGRIAEVMQVRAVEAGQALHRDENGRAACWERGVQSVQITVVAG